MATKNALAAPVSQGAMVAPARIVALLVIINIGTHKIIVTREVGIERRGGCSSRGGRNGGFVCSHRAGYSGLWSANSAGLFARALKDRSLGGNTQLHIAQQCFIVRRLQPLGNVLTHGFHGTAQYGTRTFVACKRATH